MDKEYKIKEKHSVDLVREISVDWNGWNFLIIYGKHINGWVIAVPNWSVCIEAGDPTNIDYNARKLYDQMKSYSKSRVIARAVCEHWEGINKNESED